ncbi:MAG TPA: hypothetical protein VIM16_14590 [Mucilaginibacter sp.]|jgi:hypothetical protein
MFVYRFSEELAAIINSVTGEQINHTLDKYIVGLQWSYLDNPKLGDDAADAFK